jgi:CRP/FNR family transcriptional regulator
VIPPEVLVGSRTRAVKAGQVLYRSGAPPGAALVEEGVLRVYLASDSRQVTLRYARKGDLIGAAAVLTGPSAAHVQALTQAKLRMLDFDRLRDLSARDAEVANWLARDLAERLNDAFGQLALRTFGTIKQRVARHILDMAGEDLTAPVKQQDIADAIGSVREVVSRALSELRHQHLVATGPRGVKILDPDRLVTQVTARPRERR